MSYTKSFWECDGCGTEHESDDEDTKVRFHSYTINGQRDFGLLDFDSWQCAANYCQSKAASFAPDDINKLAELIGEGLRNGHTWTPDDDVNERAEAALNQLVLLAGSHGGAATGAA